MCIAKFDQIIIHLVWIDRIHSRNTIYNNVFIRKTKTTENKYKSRTELSEGNFHRWLDIAIANCVESMNWINEIESVVRINDMWNGFYNRVTILMIFCRRGQLKEKQKSKTTFFFFCCALFRPEWNWTKYYLKANIFIFGFKNSFGIKIADSCALHK